MKHDTERATEGLRHLVRVVAVLFVLVAAAALAGCGTAAQLQVVKVAVPVECREEVPARPVMPTESLVPADTLDAKTKAALAEIELREGYEGKLLAALQGCTRPLDAARAAAAGSG